jgi:hypothetical protein
MGGNPDRAGCTTNQPCDGLDIQARDDPQHDDLGLQRHQPGHQRQRPFGVQALQHNLGRVRRDLPPGVTRFGHEDGSSPGTAATLIDGPAPRGGEDPPAPSHLIAAEPDEPTHHGDPGLRGDVLINLARDDARVSHQGRVDVKPEAGERSLVTALCAGQDAGEVLADHTSQYRSQTTPTASDRVGHQPIG